MTLEMQNPAADAPVAGRDDRWVRRVSGTDAAEATAFFSAWYDLRDPELRLADRRRFHWDFAAVGDDTVSLRTSTLAADFRTSSRSDDDYMVVWNRQGTSRIRSGGQARVLRHGMPMLLPFGRDFEAEHSDVSMSLVQIAKHAVQRAVGDADPKFDSFASLTPASVARWQHVVRTVSPRFLDLVHPPTALERRSTADALIDAFLRMVPRDRLPGTDGRGPEYERLRRAVDFVHENAHLPIGTPEIGAAAELSPRGVQQSFKRHLNTTPGDFLRGVRLDAVRAELRRAEPGETTVADVARTWGFGHLGRFSAAYRRRFGEFPSDTLRDRGLAGS